MESTKAKEVYAQQPDYTNLANWSQQDWENLDIFTFIDRNHNRYRDLVLRKIGYGHLPADAMKDLASVFYVCSVEQLRRRHQSNLDAEGQRRNQLMLGTLKSIAATRVVDQLIKEFPLHISLEEEQSRAEDSFEYANASFDEDGPGSSEGHSYWEVSTQAFTATEREMWEEEQRELEELNHYLDLSRKFLTRTQHQYVSKVIRECFTPADIAEEKGCTRTTVRIGLREARRRMLDQLDERTRKRLKHLLDRNPN